jgi:hypothetical protein
MMTPDNPAEAAQLLCEAVDTSERIVALVELEEDSWFVELVEDGECLVEFDPDPPRLALSNELGEPPAGRALEVASAALSYNMLWRETGGARIAQAGDGGTLLLIRELAAFEGPAQLAAAIEHFANTCEWWLRFVTSEASDISETPPPPMSAMRI